MAYNFWGYRFCKNPYILWCDFSGQNGIPPSSPIDVTPGDNFRLSANKTSLFNSFLGQAIESKVDVGLNEETLVPAFVSVVNGIGCLAMHQAVADVQVKTRQIIEERIKHEAKKVTRGL